MEENELRKAYRELQQIPCAFEKAVLSRRCECECAQRFNVAEREGVTCTTRTAQPDCMALLSLLHEHARFTLRLIDPDSPLPHGKEIKVQCGGLLGLQRLLQPDLQDERVGNVHALVQNALRRYGSFEKLPTEEIVRGIATFQARRRRE